MCVTEEILFYLTILELEWFLQLLINYATNNKQREELNALE